MIRVDMRNIERYLILNNELSLEDPYNLKKEKDEFIKEEGEKLGLGIVQIYILCEGTKDIGFIKAAIEEKTLFVDQIYIKKSYKNKIRYKIMVDYIKEIGKKERCKTIKYIALEVGECSSELVESGFKITKEHIQMEKKIGEIKEENLELSLKSFYELQDVPWIYDFMKDCMQEEEIPYSKEEVEKLVNENSDLAVVLYREEKPVGFIVAFINKQRNMQEKQDVIYIEEISIKEQFRNKGWATRLISYILDRGKKEGMDTGRLHVYRHNKNAYNLYKKLGFSEVKIITYWEL